MKTGSGVITSTSGCAASPKPIPQSTASHRPPQRYRLRFMPISPVPPRGRKARSPDTTSINSLSRSPSIAFEQTYLARQSRGGIALSQHAQTVKRQIRFNLVDHGGSFGEKRGKPTGRHNPELLTVLVADARNQAFDQPHVAPKHARLHGGHRRSPNHRLG